MSAFMDEIHAIVRKQEWERSRRLLAEAKANDPERKLGRGVWTDRELAEYHAQCDAECGNRYDG